MKKISMAAVIAAGCVSMFLFGCESATGGGAAGMPYTDAGASADAGSGDAGACIPHCAPDQECGSDQFGCPCLGVCDPGDKCSQGKCVAPPEQDIQSGSKDTDAGVTPNPDTGSDVQSSGLNPSFLTGVCFSASQPVVLAEGEYLSTGAWSKDDGNSTYVPFQTDATGWWCASPSAALKTAKAVSFYISWGQNTYSPGWMVKHNAVGTPYDFKVAVRVGNGFDSMYINNDTPMCNGKLAPSTPGNCCLMDAGNLTDYRVECTLE